MARLGWLEAVPTSWACCAPPCPSFALTAGAPGWPAKLAARFVVELAAVVGLPPVGSACAGAVCLGLLATIPAPLARVEPPWRVPAVTRAAGGPSVCVASISVALLAEVVAVLRLGSACAGASLLGLLAAVHARSALDEEPRVFSADAWAVGGAPDFVAANCMVLLAEVVSVLQLGSAFSVVLCLGLLATVRARPALDEPTRFCATHARQLGGPPDFAIGHCLVLLAEMVAMLQLGSAFAVVLCLGLLATVRACSTLGEPPRFCAAHARELGGSPVLITGHCMVLLAQMVAELQLGGRFALALAPVRVVLLAQLHPQLGKP